MSDGSDGWPAASGELTDSPELCRALIEANPDCVKVLSLDGRLELMNGPGLRTMQIDDFAKVAGAEWAALWPADEQTRVRTAVAQALAGSTARFQGFCPTARGEPKWWDVAVFLVSDPAGRPWRLLSISRDITEQRRAADREHEQSRFGDLATKVAGVGYWRLDVSTREITWSEQMFAIYGLEPDAEPALEHAMSLVHPDDQAASNLRLMTALATGVGWNDATTRLVRPDGEIRWVEGNGVCGLDADGAVRSMMGTMIDVTARKRAEQEAVEAEARRNVAGERMALAVEAAEMGIWDWNAAEDLLVWDDRMFEIFGLDRSIRPNVLLLRGLIHADDREGFRAELKAALANQAKFEAAYRIHRPDGEIRHLRNLGSVVRGPDGEVERMVGVTWDITELHTLQATLEAREAHLQGIIDNARQAIVTVDSEDHITGWNLHAEQIFGWSAAEALGRKLADLTIPEALRADYEDNLARSRATGQRTKLVHRMEAPALRKNGEQFQVEVSVSSVLGPDGWERTALMQDISERKAQTELFENAFHHAAIGKALVGLDGRFLKVNTALCDLVGYEEARLLELDFQAVTHPDDLQADLDLLGQLTAGEIPSYQIDERYRRSDGSLVWVRRSVSMVQEADGRPKHFIAQVQDLTARRQAESRYQLIAENITDVIITTDLAGITTFVSPSWRRITGYAPEDLIGHNPIELAHPDDLDAIGRVFGGLVRGGGGESIRWRLKHRIEDRWVWLESNPSLLPAESAGGTAILLDVLRDVTVQVEQEQALAEAMVAAEAAAAAKSEFLANMSHEIRTPLTAIIGFSALVAHSASLDAVARGQVERVSSAGQALLSIVNDVLDFSKLEAGQFEIAPRPTQPVELARDALLMFTPQAAAKGLQLDFIAEGPIPAWTVVDPDRLRQILLNLIGNALKFTERGAVRLRLSYDPGLARLCLAVEDTGVGLTEAEQAMLFRRFSQVDASSTRRHGGTGLGLAICKGLAEAMGGEIGVTSRLGEGSSFHFHISATESTSRLDAAATGEPLASLEGVRVLVVDDNPGNRELARAVLERTGAEVTEAADGDAAVQAATALPYDIILLDIRMPGLDGPATLKLIRSGTGPNQSIPILAFTADADPQRLVDCEGFDDVVRKPIQASDLVNAVAKWTCLDEGPPSWETTNVA